jgi:hypothetical protein
MLVQRLEGDGDDFEDEDEPSADSHAASTPGAGMNILTVAPLPQQSPSSYRSEPTWLLSASEIKKRPARLQFDTVSLHILNQGHGPACLVTIREIDEEEEVAVNHKKDAPLLETSKKGIIGRIVTGTRIKILKVTHYSHN